MYRGDVRPPVTRQAAAQAWGAKEKEAAATAKHRGRERTEPREAAITAALQLDQLLIVNMLLINNLGKAESWIDAAGV